MATSSRDKTVNRSPVARAQQAELLQGSAPRMVGAARGILLFLLVAVVVGGATAWFLLRSGDTEPSADLSQMMEQATEGASEATDAASEAVENVADAASEAASTATETTEQTIEAVGEEIQTQTDAALGSASEATDSIGQAAGQAMAGDAESLAEPAAPALDTGATESASDIITESTSEPLSATEAPTTPPEIVSPTGPESAVSEPAATPAPEQTAPAWEASESETSPTSETLAMTEPATASSSAGSETITVKPGEYLYSIAKRIYGDASKWRLIYDANRDQLSDPDAVRVGMKLVAPAAN